MRVRWLLSLGVCVVACSSLPEVVVEADDLDDDDTGAATGGKASTTSSSSTSDPNINLDSGGTGGSSSGSGTSSSAGGAAGAEFAMDVEYPDTTFDYTPLQGNGESCANVQGQASEVSRPIDIIVSIDNSGSMTQEIEAVQARINDDFAQILEDSNIDYRVIMVSRYGWVLQEIGGSNNPVCIGPPLGVQSCTDANYPMLQLNAPRFYHHSTDIESRNMWCRLLDSYNSADEVEGGSARDSGDPHYPWVALAPNGWQEWLRVDAFKVFVGITDDRPGGNGCTAYTDSLAGAQAWDEALRTLAPQHFGAFDAADPDANRNYAWYSIVGMTANTPETTPWPSTAPVQSGTCPDGVAAGEGYQHLSIMTDALRYPNCLNDDFDAVFNAIAQGVIERSQVPCEFDIPTVDGIIDPDRIVVSYVPGGSGSSTQFGRVQDANACSGQDVYFDDNLAPSKVFLCPQACTLVQADEAAQISLDFGCLGS